MSTIKCTWDEFKKICKEYIDTSSTASYEELEAGWKCIGLAYLGLEATDALSSNAIEVQAPVLMRIMARHKLEAELKLDEREGELLRDLRESLA